MDDAELRGQLQQIRDDVQNVRDIADELGRQLADHRLAAGAMVHKLEMSMAILTNNVNTLVTSIAASVERSDESNELARDLVSEMKQKRSHEEWEVALNKAHAPKRVMGRTVHEWIVIALLLTLVIIAGLLNIKLPSLATLFGG